MNQNDSTDWLKIQLRKSVSIDEARKEIAKNAGQNGLNLYRITDIAESLNESFQKQKCFPFDFSDKQSELFYKLAKLQAAQTWTGTDLKILTFFVLCPCDPTLNVVASLFKRLPKSVQLTWTRLAPRAQRTQHGVTTPR